MQSILITKFAQDRSINQNRNHTEAGILQEGDVTDCYRMRKPSIDSQNIVSVNHTRNRELGSHPVLNSWTANRELSKLQDSYKRVFVADHNKGALSRVEDLRAYVENVKAVYEREIASGRYSDTPDFWVAAYSQRVLPQTQAKINSLLGSIAFRLMVKGGGTPAELASAQEAKRDLMRLRAGLEEELQNALIHSRRASEGKNSVALAQKTPAGDRQSQVSRSSLRKRINLRSPLRRAIWGYLSIQPNASDKEILKWLEDSNPKVIPKSWEADDSLPSKTFTRIRTMLFRSGQASTF